MLGLAGFAGAFIRGLIAPEKRWKRRVAQAVIGFFSAIFLGGFIGSLVEDLVTVPAYAYLAAGFVCGTAGEAVIIFAQKKILGKDAPIKEQK